MLRTVKFMLIMVAASIQGGLLSQFFSCGTEHLQLAGEVPEPGTILLFAMGAFMLRNQNKKRM